ncbi:metallophosphoesterase [Streptomyces sp. WMMC897]|uniref:metallophosphoesterase n=1 Tax=Streptomyces sp. WMMC897 TaxID=3014782 RepID=UPI0022B681E2|nr:metallophosphoesterase [Streptomyces sp. WMMC897]MCZ7415299.1 metallophosphoesterase [Streptomyces sp. WMMC897]
MARASLRPLGTAARSIGTAARRLGAAVRGLPRPRLRLHSRTRPRSRIRLRLRRRPGGRPGQGSAFVPELVAASGQRRWVRALGLVLVTVLGAWLGLLTVGNVHKPVGPMDTTMTLRPSLDGGTRINVAPLGALELESHRAPLRLDVDVTRLDPERVGVLVDRPERLNGLQDQVAADVRSGTRDLALRSSLAVVLGATVLGLAVYRRPPRALAAGGLALVLLAGSAASAAATWNPKSVLEPKFSGLLAGAPSLVGNARNIASDFDVYQKELARLVTNMTRLYEAVSTLPTYTPDPDTIRVLHVSDIHLNPASWPIIDSLVEQYDIDVVIDTGDTMDHGTAAENGFLDPASRLDAPFLWVRGNHDSLTTQEYLRGLDNVHVLDNGEPVEVAGLRIAGMGDPQFTPDRSVVAAGDPAERAAGRALADVLRARAAAGEPVDIAVAHNPVLAEQTDGTVPLALAGHTHDRKQHDLPRGTRLMVEGSSGGAGLRAVEGEAPEEVTASVLYLDQETRKLQAWDEITLGGLGLTSAEINRQYVDAPMSEPSGKPTSEPTDASTGPSESPTEPTGPDGDPAGGAEPPEPGEPADTRSPPSSPGPEASPTPSAAAR